MAAHRLLLISLIWSAWHQSSILFPAHHVQELEWQRCFLALSLNSRLLLLDEHCDNHDSKPSCCTLLQL